MSIAWVRKNKFLLVLAAMLSAVLWWVYATDFSLIRKNNSSPSGTWSPSGPVGLMPPGIPAPDGSTPPGLAPNPTGPYGPAQNDSQWRRDWEKERQK